MRTCESKDQFYALRLAYKRSRKVTFITMRGYTVSVGVRAGLVEYEGCCFVRSGGSAV